MLPIVAGFLSSDRGLLDLAPVAKYALFVGFVFSVLLAMFYV